MMSQYASKEDWLRAELSNAIQRANAAEAERDALRLKLDFVTQERNAYMTATEVACEERDALRAALHEIAEEYAGSECGEPITAQEAYAVELARRMGRMAAEARDGHH